MEGGTDGLPEGRLHGRAWCGRFAGSPSCALERNKKDALQRNSGIVLSPSCALERNKKDPLQRNSGIVLSPSCVLERNKESIKGVINGLI